MQVAVLDTDVFSALYVSPKRYGQIHYPTDAWEALLSGVRVAISFQTKAELLAGARYAGWGDGRVEQLVRRISLTPVIGLDEQVLHAYVALTAECKSVGHALYAKAHTGDRWIASTAVAKGLPLLSGDQIYHGAPGVELLDARTA